MEINDSMNKKKSVKEIETFKVLNLHRILMKTTRGWHNYAVLAKRDEI